MDAVFEFLCKIYPLSYSCIACLKRLIRHKQILQDEVLLEIGEVNRNLYFILKGGLHCYYYVKRKPVSDWFFWEQETVVAIGSFYDQLPSEDRIVALEDTELLYITKDDYDYLNRTFLEFNFVRAELLQKYLKEFHAHPRFIRKHNAEERYKLVLKKKPKLVQRVPLGALASWLAMTPETMSRIRNPRD
jgi:CRP/FNR family transcriptional regulator, anaerobic regulatory protein